MNTRPTMRATLESLISALQKGQTPKASSRDFSCFSETELKNHPNIPQNALAIILASLSKDDIPTLKRALRALDETTPSWIGFKFVTDPVAAIHSKDTDVVGIKGKGQGSADAQPGIFFANEEKELVFSRPYSKRDLFQMLDITRGPHMHNEQYAGVAWLSVPLEHTSRAFIFGAGEVPLWVARMAHDVGFTCLVIDDDERYLSSERFPHSELILIKSYQDLSRLDIGKHDYVLVLTRGHMHDPEALIYGINTGAHYVGMMGSATKNDRVFEMVKARGLTAKQIEATYSPIGLKFGAKTPPELALCIVAEMIQVRAQRRKASYRLS